MKDRYFGVAHYYATNLQDKPEVVAQLLELLRSSLPGSRVSFYGMLSGSDKFCKPTVASSESLRQLVTDVRGGVFSDLTAYSGSRSDPQTSLAVQIVPSAPPSHSLAALIVRIDDHSWLTRAEALGEQLWRLLAPAYGFVTLGYTFADVGAELNCVPISRWGTPHGAEQHRLLRLQEFRQVFGSQVRGSAWGTFLGCSLLARLGGLEGVRQHAPVFQVRDVAHGGLYLRLTRRPEPLDHVPSADLERLAQFLAPITPDELLRLPG